MTARTLSDRVRGVDRDALGIWLATRVSMWVIAGATGWMFVAAGQDVVPALDRWQQWDYWHYLGIAVHGYGGQPTGVPNEAFFPGFPAFLWLGDQLGLRHVAAGLIVSLVAGAVAAVALGRIGELEGGQRIGRLTVVVWAVSPSAVFLAAPYTEALFLACAFPAWLAARRQHWLAAGVLTALSCTVRVSGVFLAVAVAVHWLTTRREAVERSGRPWWSGLGWLFLPALPLLAWSLYLESETGDWLAWLHAQAEGWDRHFTWPWTSLDATWQAAFGGTQSPGFAWMFRAEIVAMLVGVVLTGALLWWRRWGEATWIGLQVIAFGTSTWFFSVPRATLLWWPLWVTIALLAARRRWVLWAYLAVSVPLMSVWAAAYLTGRWAG
ncbi:mannosyltransferase family protein [Jiangella sp. DSM 45060]|uniref:mannosyltransferase family protein n=1 Tax=Jiangella sp. DSM 45060 TaxID=1798224 RepID=UPI00087D54D3|nr:mannosyltransferase family protein [Jiangella sp. DSM 45060]SDT68457.1 Dolichyl-phosphate-mannose-protein mannosyltransferase [Jiangella sp. DSM 45060]